MAHLKQIEVSEKAPRKVGVVQSDARDKTRKVSIQFSVKHPKYGKYTRRRTVLQVHDEEYVSHVDPRRRAGQPPLITGAPRRNER